MSNGTSGVGRGLAATASGERAALHAQARRYLHVAEAAMRNRAKRDANSAALLARNFARVEHILAQLERLSEAGGMPPPKPWWSELWAEFKSAIRMAGVGHRHLGLNFEGGGAG